MKVKLAKNRRTRTEQLIVRTTKGEKLDYAQAELLQAAREDALLPFSYETGKDEVRFYYDVSDTVPLETYLEARLSLAQFRAMLDDVIGAFERCAAMGLDPARLLFDCRYLRLDAKSENLAFAYLPAQNLPGDRYTAMDLLRSIAERASFVCRGNDADASAMLDYLRRQTVFSAVEFKEYLESTAFAKAGAHATADRGAAGSQPIGAGGPGSATTRRSATYDFVKAQSGSLSAQEARARQTLAEQVASDVAGTGSCETGGTAKPESGSESSRTSAEVSGEKAPSTSLLTSSSLEREAHEHARQEERRFTLVREADGSRFDVDPNGRTTLGRSNRCTVRVTGNPGISRMHAEIFVQDGLCYLVDQGSLNRTYVDGEALEPNEPAPLKRGATFELADESFRLE